jgi:glutamate synthase domain-containing protein 3
LLDNWQDARSKFVKVFPNEYKRALGDMAATADAAPSAPAKAKKTAVKP